jgi:hypothetical protein
MEEEYLAERTEQEEFTSRSQRAGGSVPSPDPTILTTAALYREINTLQVLLEQRLGALETVFSERLLAWQLSIKGQFDTIERQRIEQKADTKSALDAALQAAKDAVALQTEASDKAIAKSETATSKAIDQLAITFGTQMENFRRELGELKDAYRGFVGGITGANVQRLETHQNSQWGVGIGVAIGLALLGGIIAIGVAAASAVH